MMEKSLDHDLQELIPFDECKLSIRTTERPRNIFPCSVSIAGQVL